MSRAAREGRKRGADLSGKICRTGRFAQPQCLTFFPDKYRLRSSIKCTAVRADTPYRGYAHEAGLCACVLRNFAGKVQGIDMKGTLQVRNLSSQSKAHSSRLPSADRFRSSYSKPLRQSLELTRRLERRSPRLMLAGFSLSFLVLCFTLTWAASGGKQVFGANIAGVADDDPFYLLFLEDEARANIAGPKGGPEPATLKLFSYTVNKDDYLSRIAEKTGVTIDALISLNKLSDAHALQIGQQLTIPNQKGISYKVKRGDTVAKLAQAHKITSEAIRDANGLLRDEIEAESVIFLPGAKLSSEEMDKALGLLFIRPVAGGWVSSRFGTRRDPYTLQHQFHAGLDIALPSGTPIVAVRNGQVTFSGWNGGYGRMVSIKHTDGYTSLYGHMQRFIVSNGQQVRAGQTIGFVGSTGYSTGPHLHFELRHNGRLVNPMDVPGFRRAFGR